MEEALRIVPVMCAVLVAFATSGCVGIGAVASVVGSASLAISGASAAAAVVGPSNETKSDSTDDTTEQVFVVLSSSSGTPN